MDIAPGKTVSVEITAPPTNAAAEKTLYRLCRKDPRIAKAHRVRKCKRPSWQTWRRGGRFWHHQMKSRPLVKLTTGSRYSVLATVDVIRDLQSVSRYVKVTAD
uniref:Uncharacterized protein n=1 Tax=uncultured Planctomycetota bacterium TaxID=120965 RepID=A0A5B8JUE0_9BACT|nr:hypothetical protein fos2004AM_00002 [uncultured Planctomycetota bacterium]